MFEPHFDQGVVLEPRQRQLYPRPLGLEFRAPGACQVAKARGQRHSRTTPLHAYTYMRRPLRGKAGERDCVRMALRCALGKGEGVDGVEQMEEMAAVFLVMIQRHDHALGNIPGSHGAVVPEQAGEEARQLLLGRMDFLVFAVVAQDNRLGLPAVSGPAVHVLDGIRDRLAVGLDELHGPPQRVGRQDEASLAMPDLNGLPQFAREGEAPKPGECGRVTWGPGVVHGSGGTVEQQSATLGHVAAQQADLRLGQQRMPVQEDDFMLGEAVGLVGLDQIELDVVHDHRLHPEVPPVEVPVALVKGTLPRRVVDADVRDLLGLEQQAPPRALEASQRRLVQLGRSALRRGGVEAAAEQGQSPAENAAVLAVGVARDHGGNALFSGDRLAVRLLDQVVDPGVADD